MDLKVVTKHPMEISENYIPQQTTFWANFKQRNGWHVQAFHLELSESDSLITYADMLILTQRIAPDATMAYIPYIPFEIPAKYHYGDVLEQITESIKLHLPKDCLFLRFDVSWESPWVYEPERFDANGNWLGNPAPHVRELRMNFGTRTHALRKAGTDVLPSNTLFVDLNKRPESILQKMKSKTRYNVRLSERKGVSVRRADKTELPTWYRLYRETTLRNHIHYDDYQFFEALWKAQKKDPETKLELLLAEKDNEPLAGMILTMNNGRATYLYGASSSKNRDLMGPYRLQWEAMLTAQQNGCETYDMFGVSPSDDPTHPMYGLYRFKKGFGGHLFHRQGCWDYVFNEREYQLFRTEEQQMQGYHN